MPPLSPRRPVRSLTLLLQQPRLADRLLHRDGRLDRLRRGFAARTIEPRSGGQRFRHRRPRPPHRARSPQHARPPRATGCRGCVVRAGAAGGLAGRFYDVLARPTRCRRCGLARCFGRGGNRAGCRPHALGARCGPRARCRAPLRRRRHLRKARLFGWDLVPRDPLADRLLRSRHPRAPGRVPAGQRTDRCRDRHPGHERRAHRSRFRALRRYRVPPGARGLVQIAAFASIVASATLLGSSAATQGRHGNVASSSSRDTSAA